MEGLNTDEAICPSTPATVRRCVCACFAFSFFLASSWLMTDIVFPAFDGMAPFARDYATTFGAVFALMCAFISMRRPARFLVGPMVLTMLAGALVGPCCMVAGAWLQNPSLAFAGSMVRSVSSALTGVYLGLALTGVSPAFLPALLAGSYALKYVWIIVLAPMGRFAEYIAFVILSFACIVLVVGVARDVSMRIGSAGVPADLAITNPLSFLPLTSGFYVAILMSAVARGFALTYGQVESQPQPLLFACTSIPVIILMITVFKVQRLDAYYIVAFAFVLAGFLLVPGNESRSDLVRPLANVILQVGNELFNFTIRCMVISLAARNIVGALPAFFIQSSAQSFGIEIGAVLGMVVNHAGVGWSEMVPIVVAIIILSFVLYNMMLLHKFSFDDTVLGVLDANSVSLCDDGNGVDSCVTIEDACSQIALEHRLTARETQVLELLARGRNVAFIQDALGLARNTVKTHVANIYDKLGMHSHQEVIDLVENRMLGKV